jgi:hypothetical protein
MNISWRGSSLASSSDVTELLALLHCSALCLSHTRTPKVKVRSSSIMWLDTCATTDAGIHSFQHQGREAIL